MAEIPEILRGPLQEAREALDRGVAALEADELDDAERHLGWASDNLKAVADILLRGNSLKRMANVRRKAGR